MQRIDLSKTSEVVEIVLSTGKLRIQPNSNVGGDEADIVQLDSSGARQTVSSGNNFLKVIRRTGQKAKRKFFLFS